MTYVRIPLTDGACPLARDFDTFYSAAAGAWVGQEKEGLVGRAGPGCTSHRLHAPRVAAAPLPGHPTPNTAPPLLCPSPLRAPGPRSRGPLGRAHLHVPAGRRADHDGHGAPVCEQLAAWAGSAWESCCLPACQLGGGRTTMGMVRRAAGGGLQACSRSTRGSILRAPPARAARPMRRPAPSRATSLPHPCPPPLTRRWWARCCACT